MYANKIKKLLKKSVVKVFLIKIFFFFLFLFEKKKGILKANWMHKIMNVQASAVVLLVEWCDRDGKDEKGRPWQVREPEIIQFITTTQKQYQHLRGMNHIVILFILSPGIAIGSSFLLNLSFQKS